MFQPADEEGPESDDEEDEDDDDVNPALNPLKMHMLLLYTVMLYSYLHIIQPFILP